MLIDRANACLVDLPDAARYGLHKLIVAAERGTKHPKYGKDILQALALIERHLERAPTLIVDAWQALATHGAGWLKRANASLRQAPAAQRELVTRFEAAIAAAR